MTQTSDQQRVEVLEGKNLFVFSAQVSTENCDAAKECHAFATQAATAQHHPRSATEQWLELYIQVMQQCGWLPVRYTVSRVTQSGMQLDLSNLLGKGLQAAAGFVGGNVGPAVLGLGKMVVDALASSSEAVQLLKRQSHENDNVGLNLVSCAQAANGEVVMLLSAVQTDARPEVDSDFLLFQWSSSGTSNYTGAAALTFHRSLYEKNRDVLLERVSSQARTTLLSIPLKR